MKGKTIEVNKNDSIYIDEIVELLSESDILSLGRRAGEISKRLVKDQSSITYIVDRNINYTNICSSKCKFCAFYRENGSSEGFLLSYDAIATKIEETINKGGIQILMQGGLHPELNIDYYEGLIKRIKSNFKIHLHSFSPPEVINISKISNIPITTVLKRLKDAGLDSIPGGGAEILDDSVRNDVSPNKCTSSEWLGVMKEAHRIGFKTTATMMFGHKETPLNIARHLLKIKKLQEETNGFTAFIPWSFQPGFTELGGITATAVEYLKVLAVSRIVLDNIQNIQASWVTQGPKIAQLALLFGANDMGSLMLEENVVRAAGVSYSLSEDDIKRLISDIGLIPKRRNMYYEFV